MKRRGHLRGPVQHLAPSPCCRGGTPLKHRAQRRCVCPLRPSPCCRGGTPLKRPALPPPSSGVGGAFPLLSWGDPVEASANAIHSPRICRSFPLLSWGDPVEAGHQGRGFGRFLTPSPCCRGGTPLKLPARQGYGAPLGDQPSPCCRGGTPLKPGRGAQLGELLPRPFSLLSWGDPVEAPASAPTTPSTRWHLPPAVVGGPR